MLIIMNAPSPYWVKQSFFLRKYIDCKFGFYSTCSELGRPEWWDLILPEHMEIWKDKIFRFKNWFFDFRILSRISKKNPEIILISGINIPLSYLAYIFKPKKTKFIYHMEIWRDAEGRPRKLLSWVFSMFYKNIDMLMVSTEEGLQYWKKFFPKKNIQIIEVSGNIDDYIAHPVRERREDLNLFFGHRLTYAYNPIYALHILKEVQQKYPEVGLFINKHGPLKYEVDDYIERNNIKNVYFIEVTKVNDLDRYYRAGDISITPALYSHGNIGTNEAMASGMPVLISKHVQYHKEQIIKYNNGFVLDLCSDQFSSKIIEYIENRSLLNQHSINSKKIIVDLNGDKVAKRLSSIFSAI